MKHVTSIFILRKAYQRVLFLIKKEPDFGAPSLFDKM